MRWIHRTLFRQGGSELPETREVILEERRRLTEHLERLEADEKAIKAEMEKVDEQIKYYRALVKDMKNAISPPLFSGLMNAMRGR